MGLGPSTTAADSSGSESIDAHWMRMALRLAREGLGRVEPNPMVGCVVVREGRCVGMGYHELFGGPHAEVRAFHDCGEEAFRGATLYVTLEPCSHYGKTPPCADLLIKHRPSRVVVAMLDPFEQVSGAGIQKLRDAGIAVEVGVLETQARALNAPYLKRIGTGLPWTIAKWAMTLDGAIATSTGDSKWISGEESRREVHQMRARMDAILVGSATVLADDPMLTARLGKDEGALARRAIRVVVDRRLQIPPTSHLVSTAREVPVWVMTSQEVMDQATGREKLAKLRDSGVRVELFPKEVSRDSGTFLREVLRIIANEGGTNVLVEGGPKVLGSLFEAGLVDQVECYIAPKILGEGGGMRPVAGQRVRKCIAESIRMSSGVWKSVGEDLHFSGVLSRQG